MSKEHQALRLHPDIKKRLKEIAEKQNRTVAHILDRMIEDGIKKFNTSQ